LEEIPFDEQYRLPTTHQLDNPNLQEPRKNEDGTSFILYSFESVIHVTPATSQSKYSSICSLHTLTNLYSSPYLIQLLQVRSIYILQLSVHYWSSKKQQPNLKRNTECTVTYPYPYTTVLFLVVTKVI